MGPCPIATTGHTEPTVTRWRLASCLPRWLLYHWGKRRQGKVWGMAVSTIDLNADLGEGYGPWTMGADDEMLEIVSSANVACGGHAGDPETMYQTLCAAKRNGVVVGAHPGYVDREGFGRRIIPMTPDEIGRMVAAQIGALQGIARLAGVDVAYVKPHGALGNLAARDAQVAAAIAQTVKTLDPELAVLAISGTTLDQTARNMGLTTVSEIFADRGYLSSGQLVPRDQPGAMIHDPDEAADRLVGMLKTGQMPTVDGGPIALAAQSICVHGDGPSALAMAKRVRQALEANGFPVRSFLPAS